MHEGAEHPPPGSGPDQPRRPDVAHAGVDGEHGVVGGQLVKGGGDVLGVDGPAPAHLVGIGRAQVTTSVVLGRASSPSRTDAGAVTSRPLSWLMAAVRALMAALRAARSARMASTMPSRRLAGAEAVPANTARAAASASIGSDLPRWP